MLHWLAGQKSQENGSDPETTGAIEPPETPAPVFAVRAFKHAIFGTPATQARKPPRRHSNNDNARPRQSARPNLSRTKSSNDVATSEKPEVAVEEEELPMPSPTKGILLTPGTATARRKTVSFPDHVVDNEGKRVTKSGLPDDCPGKFPSPWTKTSTKPNNSDEPAGKPKGRSKLTEQLEQVREESAKRKSKTTQQNGTKDGAIPAPVFQEFQSESESYWKHEYDIYREKSEKECRKLIQKQRTAKSYARAKDEECMELREQLRQEKDKFETLERRTAELESQMKELLGKLHKSQAGAHAVEDTRPKRLSALINASAPPTDAPVLDLEANDKPDRLERLSWKSGLVRRRREQDLAQSSTNTQAPPPDDEAEPVKVKQDGNAAARPRSRPRNIQTKAQDDSAPEPGQTSPRLNRAVTSGTQATPLKNLSINTLSQETRTVALSMGLQPPSPELERRQDSPMCSPELPRTSPEPGAKAAAQAAARPSLQHNKASKDELATQTPASNVFEQDASTERPNILTGNSVTVRSNLRSTTKPPDSKENVSPPSRSQLPRNEENTKPSAAWNSMNAQHGGKDLSTDRLAAARARLLNKGRNVS